MKDYYLKESRYVEKQRELSPVDGEYVGTLVKLLTDPAVKGYEGHVRDTVKAFIRAVNGRRCGRASWMNVKVALLDLKEYVDLYCGGEWAFVENVLVVWSEKKSADWIEI